jgi:hypothetical protein
MSSLYLTENTVVDVWNATIRLVFYRVRVSIVSAIKISFVAKSDGAQSYRWAPKC